ncbi:carbon storage regulator [Tatlockia micdadei]|uniref:carbon storage regulator n=1 Tax=Legionella micdadei TaxID=451 RepID=UPI00156E40FA|nr:carbon storage regulator [Legionella micdadei]NSL19578.1 carbon storage regulator [Legionella micdadei]
MLVLTRRVGEQVLIDKGQIKIKILGKKNGVIAIGINAPIHVDVDREEIFFRKLATAKFQQKAANEEKYK